MTHTVTQTVHDIIITNPDTYTNTDFDTQAMILEPVGLSVFREQHRK